METYYIVYKITNNVNGKIYIGSHKTSKLDDQYMGSGVQIRNAIKKYGLEQFSKQILFIYDNAEEMLLMESKLVNEKFVSDPNTYNIKIGGLGGWDHINTDRNSSEFQLLKLKKSESLKQMWENGKYLNRKKRIHPTACKTSFSGKKHTEAAKKKIGIKNAQNRGSKNSQYGTCWVYCQWLNKAIKIKSELLPLYLEQGWIKGRKLFN